MSVSIRTRTTARDPLARAHRRAALARTLLLMLLVVGVAGAAVWLMFSSAVFAVTEVRVNGGTASSQTAIRDSIERVLGQRTLGFFRPARNILLLQEQSVALLVRTTFADIEQVQVRKEYPHAVIVDVNMRVPLGTWCAGEECRYFDSGGVRWGSAVPSRGPLLLLVRDERGTEAGDNLLFMGLMSAVNGLPMIGLKVVTVTLPDAAPGDMVLHLDKGYDLYIDALGDVADQLTTLAIYIADKASDASWKPLYIDLRTPGRIYSK